MMNVPGLNNPFINSKMDDTTSIPPGHVPELHAAVIEQCLAALGAARQTGTSTSLLVVGEAGSGKSHMIAQFRQQLAADKGSVLAAIRLGGASAGCLWRHVRRQLATEILTDYATAENGRNGLMRILHNRFPTWSAKNDAGGSMLWSIISAGKPNPDESLRNLLDDFAQNCPSFAHKLRVVLPKWLKKDTTNLAQDWLRGEQLGADELAKLGLPPEFPSDVEQETIARSIVLSMFDLVGDKTGLFLFFDEVEAIQAGNYDASVLRQFGTLTTELLAQKGSRVIAISIRPRLQIALEKAVELSNFQKLSQYKASIPALTWEQAVRIVRCRLDAEPSCCAARKKYAQDSDWPLGGKFLDTTFTENRRNLMPRHLIKACRFEFDRIQQGRPATAEDAQPKTALVSELNGMWEHRRERFLEKPQSIQFDSVLALGLPWLANLFQLPLIRILDSDHRLGDVNLLFHLKAKAKKALGISFCNHEPKFLWHRLDRLKKQWAATKNTVLAGLVILRMESARTTATSEERLRLLGKSSVRIVRIPNQQLAELAAFQTMLTSTLEGEITRGGKPIEPVLLDSWAAEHLSESVKELLHQVFELEPGVASPATAPAPVPKKRSSVTQK